MSYLCTLKMGQFFLSTACHKLDILSFFSPPFKKIISSLALWGFCFLHSVSITEGGKITGIEKTDRVVLESFILSQNYPNPFNPETEIRFQLPEARDVQLTIYNLKGQKIRTLVNAMKETGFHSVSWNGKDNVGNLVASGVYIYLLRAGGFVDAKKLTLLR